MAENRYLLGTKTGLEKTREVFMNGKYKEQNLFLIIGVQPTTKALNYLGNLKSKTTYLQDLKDGVSIFNEQFVKAGISIPDNLESLGDNIVNLAIDPINELKEFNIITPAAIIYKILINSFKIGWYSIKTVSEPIFRLGFGTTAMVGSPLKKPVIYTGIAGAYIVTGVYGYGSSAVGGAALTGVTGAVFITDIATSPFVFSYDILTK